MLVCVPTDGRFSRLENRQKAQSRGRSYESPGSRRAIKTSESHGRLACGDLSEHRRDGSSREGGWCRWRAECARLLISWMDQHQRNPPSSVPCRRPVGTRDLAAASSAQTAIPPFTDRLNRGVYSRRDRPTNQDALGKTGDRAFCERNTTRFAEHIDNCPPLLHNSRGKGRLPLTKGSKGIW